MAATTDVQITQEIIDLAASLGNSPIKIYEYVHDNFEYEPYYGSLKGSTAALWSGAGNDYDLTSLLLALLRAVGIYSRYVSGTAVITPQQAKDWLGVQDAREAAEILASDGISTTTYLLPDNTVGAIAFEHVWAQAYVPYGNYRGLGSDNTDKLWVPMDPSFKLKTYQTGIAIPDSETFDYEGYLSHVQRYLPHELYQDQIRDYLAQNQPGKTLDDVGYVGKIIPAQLDFLPATLPYTVGSTNGEFSEIPDSLRHKVTLHLKNSSGGTLFNTTLTLPAVSLDRLTISYDPATLLDAALLKAYDDLFKFPQANVTPVLRRNGVAVASGSAVPIGSTTSLVVGLMHPKQSPTETLYPVLTAGDHHAIGIYVHQTSERLIQERSSRLISAAALIGTPSENQDDLLGELLNLAVVKYYHRMDEALRTVDEIKKFRTLSFVRVGLTRAHNDVQYLDDLPFAIFPSGLFIDVKHNVVYPAPLDGNHSNNSRLLDVMKLGGYSVSALEHQIWEDLVKLDSISTMKGLQFANESAIPVRVCTDANCINNTQLDQSTKNSLIAEINNGQEITVPNDEFTYNDWRGVVWITRNPANGSAGYIITGGFDGGATTTGTIWPEPVYDYGLGPGYVTTDGDPVNIANGNLIHPETDFTIKSRGLSLLWSRTYNSKLDYDGPMGYGWTHSYNIHLTQDGNGDVTLMDADGAKHFFDRQPNGSYLPPPGIHSTLTKTASDFTLREKDGMTYRFDLSGRLLSITDPTSNQVTLSYSSGRLTTITDPVGRSLTLTYNAGGRLASITDFTARQWAYGYDGAGNLTSVTNPLSQVTTYTYYSGQFNAHNMHQVIDARGNAMTFFYYTNEKVFRHVNALGETRTFSYNPFWQETKVVNEEGYVRIYTYDEDGNLIKLVEETGGVRTYTWDDDRNLLTHTDPFSNTTSYQYDGQGNLTRVVNPLGHVVTYQYEPTYNKRTRIDDNGRVTLMAYDSHGNLISTTDALGNVTTSTYDAYGQPLTVTGPRNNLTVNTYDASGNLIQVRDALGNTTQYEYDGLGRLTRTVDANSHPTVNEYDALDRLLKVTDALSKVTRYQYDQVGNQTVITNALGYATTHVYDAANRRVQTVNALGNVTRFEYDGLGNLIAQTDPLGNRTAYEYDGLGNRTRMTDPLGNVAQSVYDANKNPIQIIDANGNATTKEYDALNRLVRTTDPLAHATHYQYDIWGNTTVITDANLKVTQHFYDALNRRVRTVDALNQEVGYGYDALGNTTVITDANGHALRQEFDLMSRLVTVTDAESKTTRYGYDGVGSQTVITDAKGLVTHLTYDEVNRLTERRYADNSADTFQYDAVGNMLQAVSPAVTLSYQYDALGRLTRSTDSRFGKSIQYGYDAAGNRASMTNPEGGVTTYQYDRANRLASQIEPDGVTAFYAYDPTGNRIQRRLSLGHLVAYSYDAANRLTSLVNYGPSSAILAQQSYTYDAVGNILSMTDARGAHTYTYNAVYWLTRANYPWGDFEAFTYDAAGNRLTRTDSSGTINSTYDAANRLLAAGSTTFAYDNNGNLIRRTDASGATDYTFDQRNQLVGVQFPAGSGLPNTVIAYDALGNRVRKVDSQGETRYFVDDRRQVVSEYNGGNAWQATYRHGSGLDELIGRTTGSQAYYYLTDAMRSVVAIADAAGQTLAAYSYKAFGKIASQTGSLADNQSFVGRELDPDSGLLYMRARYYDPVAGRFVSADPIGYQGGINLYTYASNNPVRLIDPFGTNPEDWLDQLASGAKKVGKGVWDFFVGEDLATLQDPNASLGEKAWAGIQLGATVIPVAGVVTKAAKGLKLVGKTGKALKMLDKAEDLEDLVKAAQKLYPQKAGLSELHHIIPKYLGGDPKGATKAIDAAYHQLITNEFRRLWEYGKSKPSLQQLQEIVEKVYQKFPLP